MMKVVDGVEVEMTPEEIAAWEAEQVEWQSQPPPPYKVYRSTFVSRMSNDEATTLEATVATAEPKLRLMYQSVEYFVSNDPLFAVLHWTVSLALGSEEDPNFLRADALMAPG